MGTPPHPGSPTRSSPRRRRVLLGGSVAAGTAGVIAGIAYRRRTGHSATVPAAAGGGADPDHLALGWGEGAAPAAPRQVRTRDGARLALWDVGVEDPGAPTVVLPHCWGCSHEIWLPVARRLRDRGYRVVLYDQRGHGASTRGTAPLDVETLAHDFAAVLEAADVRDAVLAGHSMGGMTIMSLASYRPLVLEERAKAAVLVATAAKNMGDRSARSARMARSVIASPMVTRALRARNGHVLVRGVFGVRAERAHLELTRDLFAGCDETVRGDFLVSLVALDLLEGIATMNVPTTVMVGSRDTLTVPAKATEIASTVPGARLVTLEDRGHMLPLEDPDAVTDEILRATKG